jgi:hypothetical protein
LISICARLRSHRFFLLFHARWVHQQQLFFFFSFPFSLFLLIKSQIFRRCNQRDTPSHFWLSDWSLFLFFALIMILNHWLFTDFCLCFHQSFSWYFHFLIFDRFERERGSDWDFSSRVYPVSSTRNNTQIN